MRGLTGKMAIVTGGGGGIGSAVCQRLAEEGVKVAVFDIDEQAALATSAAITEAGGTATAFAADITDYQAVTSAVASAQQALGPVDILVNNAGWDLFKPFVDTQPEDWERIIAINLVGMLNLHHVVLPAMVENGGGRVVNVASDAARVGSSGESVYAACKGGVVSFSKTLAREHARHGISVNVICPGPTQTTLFQGILDGANNPDKLEAAFAKAVPMGRLGQPEDLPGLFAFLASDDAAYITGQVISVSGGLTMNG